jgi:site-specific DNA recombinase
MSEQMKRLVRCATYTRKSTEEGLDQAFNSLDAQKEACAAYIRSQQHEGWRPIEDQYDDGGFSGGSMDRPALMRLLDDVRRGRVDVIVLYKIDRLTRSLADFARIIDVLDSCGASFVSVTQSFCTTSSMGRLTLNVLLSFAQFERELTGERIRDKIAASKRRGMWMGGVVPLGYDVADRKLIVNASEAQIVRDIYQRYLKLGSVLALQSELMQTGVTSKRRLSRSGSAAGGVPFTRGALYLLLQNRIYVGQICHKGAAYPGEHEAIVPTELFDAVQAQLEGNRVIRLSYHNSAQPNLLAGLLWDAHGRPMTTNHTVKAKVKRYRYYVSRNPVGSSLRVWRVPAGDLEELVVAKLRAFLSDEHAVFVSAGLDTCDAATTRRVLAACSTAADALHVSDPARCRSALNQFLDRVVIYDGKVELTVKTAQLNGSCDDSRPDFGGHILEVPASLVRAGKQIRLTVAAAARGRPDAALVKLIVKAWEARVALESNSGSTVVELASAYGHDRQYFGVLLRISYLSPRLLSCILQGRQTAELTRQKLARLSGLPSDWGAQERLVAANEAVDPPAQSLKSQLPSRPQSTILPQLPPE